MSKGSVMKTNLDPAKCPFCGSPEVEYPTPRTVYSCGTNDYDGRPESAMQSETCKERVLAKPVHTTQFEKKFGIKEEDCKNKYELWYFKTLLSLLEDGTVKDDRTNTGTRSIPFHTYQHDLRESYPLMKSRYLDPFNPIKEMIWMLSGSSNVKPLQEMGVPFWNSFADEDGELGPVYGVQWRHWKTPDGEEVDQIQYVLDLLENEPTSRRMVVSCWNPSFIPVAKTAPKDNPKLGKMSLTPCFVAGTPVLTPHGYVDIESLNAGDLVVTDKGNIQPINHKWITEYTGEIIGLSMVYQTELIQCTPNHPFLIKNKGYIECKDIKIGDKLGILRPKFSDRVHVNNWSVLNSYHQTISHSEELNKNDYYFLGYFLGNGWVSQTQPRVSVAIPNSKVEWLLPKIRNSIKLIHKPGISPNVATYATKSQKWWGLLKEFGHGASNKKIPEWIFTSPIEFVEEFIKGYKDADGFESKNRKVISYTTTSRSLAYGLQRLYAGLGRHAAVYKQKRPTTTIIEGRCVNQKDTYMVNLRSRTVHDVEMDGDYLWVPVNGIGKKTTSCLVYNYDVGHDHTYVVHNYATHNCHFSFVLTATPMNFGDRLNYFKHSHPTIYSNLYPISGKGWTERAEEAMNHRNVPKFYLDLSFIMRSNDFILGNPANLNEYAALCMMFAQQRNMIARYVNYTGIDVHIYSNHIAGAREQIDYVKKHPEIFTDEPAKIHIGLNGKPNTIFEYTVDHFVVQDYHRENTGPVIRFPIAV
ncbi:putative thymidylate synthase [Aeromonas phage PS2]|uniref:Thymidylate synthase n=1 Tax=Aeromonas phage PS1 TaxID=2591406 RepID=A0A514TUK0_9CAUD|nr:thymidylate synthase [Aeromonas phage PS1]QDJ96702.1 putative thymidylate synthase [Aeromonas phage PS1]QFR59335.1 putative thymidylate synthase [Aeromonas phage PS2]